MRKVPVNPDMPHIADGNPRRRIAFAGIGMVFALSVARDAGVNPGALEARAARPGHRAPWSSLEPRSRVVRQFDF